MARTHQSLLGARALAKSAIWNFAGLAAPMIVGIVIIPQLIDGFGKERFGLLSIVWLGVGYFSLFDMGLGRALTKMIAEQLGRDQVDDLGPLIWTALTLIFPLGMLGSAAVFLGSEPLIMHVLKVESILRPEAVAAFKVLAVGIPVVILSSALIGVLEAHQRFDIITAVRIPLGILTFVGPMATLQFTPSLVWATVALLLARLLSLVGFFLAAGRVRTELKRPRLPCTKHAASLFRFGTWMTVTNIVGPLMVTFDRFLIGAIHSMAAITYYVTPYEVLSRLQILPRSIKGVMFPAMAATIARDRAQLPRLFGQSSLILFLMMLPLMSGAFLLAPEALRVWLGDDFRIQATPVVHWLALGWLINSLAHPALTALQSHGRPDLVAKTHLIELAPYSALLWFFTLTFGITGTAAAWCLRVLVDTIVLNELARRQLPDLGDVIKRFYLYVAAMLVGFFLASLLTSLPVRLIVLTCVVVGSAACGRPLIKKLHASRDARQGSP